ncbi:MAG: hypothetical protein U0W24_25165 [Bacteroidales bacterium]
MNTKVVFLLLSILFYLSCSLDNGTTMAVNSPISIDSVFIPDTAGVLEDAGIYAKTFGYDGCWSNLHFEFKKSKNFEYELTAVGDYASNGVCPDVLITNDTTILFKPGTVGKYYFRIRKTPKTILLDSMIIE